jgi:aldehyde dehydrogenase (NAD+)
MTPASGGIDIDRMRGPVERGDTRPLRWRLEQLERLERLLTAAEAPLADALAADLGKPELEAFLELSNVRQELEHTRRRLAGWLRPRLLALPLWVLPGQAWLQPEPLGCVLIIGPWNYPFHLCLQPLVSALAAGNTAVLKPSEHAPRTAGLIAELVAEHLPADTVRVVQGDGAVAERLLEQRFDHIFFTGGARVGRLVMAAAAQHLTPVTLELGGKSPAIVLEDADLTITARRLAWAKGLNAGQSCLAPDHLYLTPAVRQPLLEALALELRRFHGEEPLESPDLGAIVDDARFQRLETLLRAPRAEGRILLGGRTDPGRRRIEPTVVAVQDPDRDPLMQEELFGPVLPVLEVADLDGALARIRQAPKPLAIYLFSRRGEARRRLLSGSSSGCVGINDLMLHAALASVPFGGVGESGMGRYHGREGFLTFSHQRSVLQRPFSLDLPFRYPPFARGLPWLRRLLP